VLERVPAELRLGPEQDQPARWMADPTGLLQACDVAVRRLVALPAGTPSLQLLADQTAEVLAAISHALNGLALLVADPARPVSRSRGIRRLRIPDWLPSLVNAGRAFVVIGAAELFWVVTEWPNGAGAITFAAIGVILFAPRADYAYTAAFGFAVGIMIAAVVAAIIEFAVLPNLETFAAFSLAIGLWLVSCRRRGDPAMAEGRVYLHGGIFHPAARAHQSDELRHPTILQFSVSDHRGIRCCRTFISLDTASFAGISDAPALGADFARSASPHEGSDPADVGRLGGPHVWPALGIAGSSPTLGAGGNASDIFRGDGDHPASAHRSPNGSGIRTGCGARSGAVR